MNHHAAFQEWLEAGGRIIGQVVIEPEENGGGYRLGHQDDVAAIEAGKLAWDALELFDKPEDARTIALYDGNNVFRPLKTAPNLRRGWRLELAKVGELHLAIEFLYPAAIGIWVAEQAGRLQATPLEETLGRQSGMYAVTRKAAPEQIKATIASCCNNDGGCLKAVLWATPAEQEALPCGKFQAASVGKELPLLCQEACNLFVGALRAEIKK